MSKNIYEKMRADLHRPHPHAWERVGYVFINSKSTKVLEVIDYISIPDEFYVKDPTVGAHINHRGIVLAMKRADHKSEGVLQVHEHRGEGVPMFSQVDLDSHQVYLRSFRNANPRAIHGFLLLSENSMRARVWKPGEYRSVNILTYKITEDTFFEWILGLLRDIRRAFKV